VVERQTVDDLFIYLRYARVLGQDGQIAFTPGERVEGTSSVAWTLLLGAAYALGWRGVAAAKAMSLAVAAAIPSVCALAVRRALAAVAPDPSLRSGVPATGIAPDPSLRSGVPATQAPLAMALPALALAFDADLATWASSGMDTPLFALACAVCVGFAAAGRPRAAAVALGLLPWIRPESPLFTVLGAGALALYAPRDRARIALLAMAPLALLVALRVAYFHDWLPNTFYAKMRAVDGRDYTGLGYAWNAVVRRPMLFFLPLAALLLSRPRMAPMRDGGPVARACSVALALLVACFAFVVLAGGDWMPNRRLLVPALVLAAIAASIVLARMAQRGPSLAFGAVLVVEAVLTFDHALDQTWRDHEWLDRRVTAWRMPARPLREPYPLDWMPTHLMRTIAPYVAPHDTVAHVDVGELPYVMHDVAFLDGFGLVDRAAGRLTFFPEDDQAHANARDEIFARNPAIVIAVLDEATSRAISPAQAAAMSDARFALRWREIDRVPSWGNHPCVTYARVDIAPATRDESERRIAAWLAASPGVRVDE
jgi:hypothetical protein